MDFRNVRPWRDGPRLPLPFPGFRTNRKATYFPGIVLSFRCGCNFFRRSFRSGWKPEKVRSFKQCMNWGAAIAQWICRRLPFGCPGFESQAHHLCFYQFKFKLWDVEKTKLNRNIGGDWPIFKKTFVHIGSINSVLLDFDIKRCIDSVKITVVCKQIIQSETTVYLDRLSINYPPISDAFDNREYFFCIIQMIQLWHYWEITCSISINKIFFKFHIFFKAPKMGG